MFEPPPKIQSKSSILEPFIRKINTDITAKQNQGLYSSVEQIGMVEKSTNIGNTLEEKLWENQYQSSFWHFFSVSLALRLISSQNTWENLLVYEFAVGQFVRKCFCKLLSARQIYLLLFMVIFTIIKTRPVYPPFPLQDALKCRVF